MTSGNGLCKLTTLIFKKAQKTIWIKGSKMIWYFLRLGSKTKKRI